LAFAWPVFAFILWRGAEGSRTIGGSGHMGERNRLVAFLLAFFLGSFGLHKFYLGRVGWGIVYLLLCWTALPAIAGFIEGIIYLTMSDAKFAAKYG
jgi:TM2 domain-containing membrane protein YozV